MGNRRMPHRWLVQRQSPWKQAPCDARQEFRVFAQPLRRIVAPATGSLLFTLYRCCLILGKGRLAMGVGLPALRTGQIVTGAHYLHSQMRVSITAQHHRPQATDLRSAGEAAPSLALPWVAKLRYGLLVGESALILTARFGRLTLKRDFLGLRRGRTPRPTRT